MSTQTPFVITISRQLGSGGTYLGQRIAARLHIYYADRDIIRRAAGRIQLSGAQISEESIEELQSQLKSFDYTNQGINWEPVPDLLSLDNEYHHIQEISIIRTIAEHWHSVIVGRGGYYLLRENPRHLAVFIHADNDFRIRRIQDIYKVSSDQAKKLMEVSDWVRKSFLGNTIGTDWMDMRQCHLSIDTGAVGFGLAEEMILDSMQARLDV